MENFPKKYNPKDLCKWSKLNKQRYKQKENGIKNVIFSLNTLSSSTKISYQDFFPIYLRDFFNKKDFVRDENLSWMIDNKEQLFVIYGDQLENVFLTYLFFSKRNQTLPQVWKNKLERYIYSSTKKRLNANHKILDSYSSSNYKIYMPDSDLYVYVLEQFRLLWERWKIINKTKIWYRSFNLQASIPFEKISWKEKKVPYYILKYFVWTKAEALPVYVEDIDFCCGDVGLLVHPKDKRYNKYIWKNAIIPLCNRQIPIIWDENVNIALNNWIRRICPCCDEESIDLAKKYGLPTDIYVFDKEWLYTDYIHEKAFIWEQRKKYYDNIVWFIEDIWNLAEKWEKILKVPYLDEINERLVPYKMDQLIIDLREEKEKIVNKFFWDEITISSDAKLSKLIEEYKYYQKNLSLADDANMEDFHGAFIDKIQDFEEIEEMVNKEIDKVLPDSLIFNSQSLFWWKIPLIRNDSWDLTFFDIEKQCLTRKQKPLQLCFDFVLLSLIREWTISTKITWKKSEYKLWEYDKFYRLLSENEKKIEYLVWYLWKITWEQPGYDKFLQYIENITDENDSTLKDLSVLVKGSKYLKLEWNYLFVKLKWIVDDVIDTDFVELCIPCYLQSRGIKLNNQIIFGENERNKIIKELLIQELLLSDNIANNFLECSYDKQAEFLWDKQLSRVQLEQSQWSIFSLYWENPIRLNYLINKAFDQKKILLNSIFLKQIRNAVRLCVQKDFLPEQIEKCLDEQPKDFEDFDVIVLYKLNELYSEWESVETYEKYISFFNKFKESIQNIFFSRYLEIQKVSTTKNVQFVCAYFFNFLLTIMYPLTPEFVHALQYISKRDFLKPIKSLELNKSINYNLNILYNTFIKIKEMKIEYNIKQHESCNIFIKSNPTICELFEQYKQVFINYFHISDIAYLRLHEQTPLGYETFSDDTLIIGIQPWDNVQTKNKESLESIEKEIKNLDDKLSLLRQRIQILPEWEERKNVEEEYAKTKEEMESLAIKHSLLSSK